MHAKELCFSQIRGMYHIKHVLELAVIENYNVLMIGPPGCGKTMLARRLTTILPDLDSGAPHPFRAPHHTGSTRALCEEITLAHNGVLFLDDLPEFRRSTLGSLQIPWRIRLVAAMNPCPCGYHNASACCRRQCICTHDQIQRYHARIPGSFLLNIHICVLVDAFDAEESFDRDETSVVIKQRVVNTRDIQRLLAPTQT